MKSSIVVMMTCILFALLIIAFLSTEQLNKQTNNQVKESNELIIYSPLNEEIIIPIVKEFQETTGIQVNYLYAGTVDLLSQLELKGDEPLTDLIWGSSKEFLESHLAYFEPYETSHKSELNENFIHKDNYWNGFNLLPIVLMYNKKLVSPEEVPKSWEELLDPKWKGKMVYTDPHNSGSSYMVLATFLSLGAKDDEYNWKNVEKFLYNIDGNIVGKSSEVYNGIANGDFALGLTMEEAAVRLIHNGAAVGIVYLEEGTPVITDAIALMKDSENKENAKTFIEFVLSDRIQNYMVDYFYLRSIRTDVRTPESLMNMNDLTIYDTNSTEIYKQRNEILNEFEKLLLK